MILSFPTTFSESQWLTLHLIPALCASAGPPLPFSSIPLHTPMKPPLSAVTSFQDPGILVWYVQTSCHTCDSSTLCIRCKRLNSELGAQTALHLSVSKGVIQRKRESRSSATSSSNDNSRPGPMAQAVHTGMKYVLFT